jgi:hypothetical protein
MKWTRRLLALGLMLSFLQGCVGAPQVRQIELSLGAGDSAEPVANRPRFPKPRGASSPSKPAPAPETPPAATKPGPPEKPSATQASPQTQPQRKPSPVEAVMTRWLDPKVARSLFDQGMKEAKKKHPNLYGQPKQKHHIHSKYIGGDEKGPTVDLDPAYHRLITS